MVTQLAGAGVRAIFVFILVMTPALLVPGADDGQTQAVTLLALFGAAFVFSEYVSRYPGLVEFRDAPPFNRIRVISMFLTAFLLSVVARGAAEASTLSVFLNAVGLGVARLTDGALAPQTLLIALVDDGVGPAQAMALRVMMGVALVISLGTIAVFTAAVLWLDWPRGGGGAFNVWINLPTFDPAGAIDVVPRLRRDAYVNIGLGVVLPFGIPILAGLLARFLALSPFASLHSLVWVITLWGFLPVSLVMRGLAMLRVAAMIGARRARLAETEATDRFARA